MELDHQHIPYIKINSRWIKDISISGNTIKLIEENIGQKISNIAHSNILVTVSPRRGVKLIFTGGHISLMVAFKGPNVILGLCKCNYSLTRGKKLGTATG